jgi:hypothetical protein
LPTHWLGRAEESLLELPVAPELVEPEPIEPEPLAPEPELPPTLGLVVELPPPVLPALPELCAQDTVARPSRAAATAALSFFAITMNLSFG